MRRVGHRRSNRGIVMDHRPSFQHGDGSIESPARIGTQDTPNPSDQIDLPTLPGLEEALAEQVEAGAAVHLALQQLHVLDRLHQSTHPVSRAILKVRLRLL